jgi:hypothetical protein
VLDLKYKTILKVAVPLMVSSFIQSVVLITDAAFLSRHSTLSFDAVGNAGLIYVTVFMALAGMGDGAQILIAKNWSEKHRCHWPNFRYFYPIQFHHRIFVVLGNTIHHARFVAFLFKTQRFS